MKQKRRNILLIMNIFGIWTTTKTSNSCLFGSIYDKETGKPIKEASVIIFNKQELIAGKITDANGNYKFDNLPPNSNYSLKVIKNGYYYFHSEELISCPETSKSFEIKLIKMEN
jgi:hypothetical protein